MSDLREKYAEAIVRARNANASMYGWQFAAADAVLAIRDAELERLRARLAAVEALAEEWSKTPQPPDEEYEGTTEGHWAFGEWLATTSNARAIRAALASVPAVDAGDREPASEVWVSTPAPGGWLCSACGTPVESEPCPDHGQVQP